jgi:PAS domain S-box-containing protein
MGHVTEQLHLIGATRQFAFVAISAVSLFLIARLDSFSPARIYAWFQASYLVEIAGITAIAMTASILFLMRKRRRGPLGPPVPPVDNRQELADALPHILWGTGADGRCEFLNERYTETFGIPRIEAIRDQSWADPIHPVDRPKMYQAWRGAVENGSSNYSAYARVRMNDGSYRWMESLGRSVRSPESGEVVKWFGSLVDVQSQVEDREMISRLQFDLQTVADECEKAVARCDERLSTLFNTREIAWLEYDIASAKPISDMLRENGALDISGQVILNPALTDKIRETIRIRRASEGGSRALGHKGTLDTVTEWARTDNFRKLDVEIAILAAMINGLSSTCGIAELIDADGEASSYPFSLWITDDGAARVSLFDTRGSDERIGEAGAARKELSKANRIACASALSTSLVHEMSQPITAISLDLATADRLVAMGPRGAEAVAKVMDRLRWNAQRLTDIVTRTRDSLKPNRLNRQPVDIFELAVRSRNFVLGPFDPKHATVTVTADDDLSLIDADPVALQQVLCALLLNALEAGDAIGKPASVTVAISRPPQATELRISVSDRGSGVQEEHLSLAFDPFFSTKPNRLGFGLTVCQSVVEGFGGTLTLHNRNGGGAVAAFSIPLNDAAAAWSASI